MSRPSPPLRLAPWGYVAWHTGAILERIGNAIANVGYEIMERVLTGRLG